VHDTKRKRKMRSASSTTLLVIASLSIANVLLPVSCFIPARTSSKSPTTLLDPIGKYSQIQRQGIIRNEQKHGKIRRSKSAVLSLQMAQVPLIDDWSISFRGDLSGTVSNHPDPDIGDGDDITTSKLDTDKANCKQGVTVVTVSGSKYRLGSPKGGSKVKNNAASKEKAKSSPFNFLNKKDDASKIKLSGKTIGDGKYVLVGKPRKSTSGKSQICTAYRSSDPLSSSPEPIGKPLVAKLSSNIESLAREDANYNKVTSGLFQGRFVEKVEYLPRAGSDFKAQGALVLEEGAMDLKEMLARLGDGVGLKGRGLRDVAASAAQCIQAMHSSGLVWTDLKSENFVVVLGESGKDGSDGGTGGLPGVKAIDLESACPHKNNPIDFSPEACPPEFAKEFVKGDGEYFILDYNYDIWSFGMMMYELSTGNPYFKRTTPAQVTRLLMNEAFEVDVSAIEDKLLRDLVKACLDKRPNKRPNINQILLHPYFITTGIGPFGF